MIAIIDYGVGNIFSLTASFRKIGAEVVLTSDAETIRKSEKLILPGVGAFSDARRKLAESGLDRVLCKEAEKGKPLLGICLGMQLLFDKSFEFGEHTGLGLIPGKVVPMEPVLPKGYKIPHIGWNALHLTKPESPLYRHLREGDAVYFVHSYYASDCETYVSATTEYGAILTASAERGNVYGVQFHPEKSGNVGLGILRGFCEL